MPPAAPASPDPTASRLTTSLGPELVCDGGQWQLDLRELPMLRGLSVLSRALGEMVLAQARSERTDVGVERRLRPRENPELIERFHLEAVKVVAEHGAITDAEDQLEARLRALLGSLQRQRYRDALFHAAGDRGGTSRALVAEFADDAAAAGQRFVLEHLPARHQGGRGSLRITIEHQHHRRLDLGSLPHLSIADVADRHFIAGSTRIAETWTEAMRREAARGRRSFVEQRVPHSHLFHQLDQAGLGSIQRVALQWAETALPFLLENEPPVTSDLLKRVLLALEDGNVRRLLGEREAVRVDAGDVPVFLDKTQLGRVLAISLGQRRERADADAFLQRMPRLLAAIAAPATTAPLRDVSVFLVHHMTAEVVGLIAALRALGCRDLVCLFVTYAGEPPASYLDAVLDLPTEEFTALALDNVPHRGSVEGSYRLSPHYSQLPMAETIAAALQAGAGSFLAAMRTAATAPFLAQLARTAAAGRRCLLVEDGGYLGPLVHAALLAGDSVRTFAANQGLDVADDRPFATVASPLLGTVEHTRNGFDRLVEVERRHGRLRLPAWSIAVSRLKRDVESREVAASVLNAVESVLNADGRILARRRCLVLGSGGAIGRELCRSLRTRLDDAPRDLAGIDLAATGTDDGNGLPHATTLAGLGDERWLATDLVLGVTGQSVLSGTDLERWLLHGHRDTLVLASGSTKKVEFAALMQWLAALLRADAPSIAGRAVTARVEEFVDPRTARAYGHRWTFVFADGRRRAVLALGNLTPINFLFYGVATELIDEVLAQLTTLTLGAVRRGRDGSAVPGLAAVDRDCDAHGEPLPPDPGGG